MRVWTFRNVGLAALLLAIGPGGQAGAQVMYAYPEFFAFGQVKSPWYSYEYYYVGPGPVTYGFVYPQVPLVYGPQVYTVRPPVPPVYGPQLYPLQPNVPLQPPVRPPTQTYVPPPTPGRYDGRGYRSPLLARIKHPTPALAPLSAAGEPNAVDAADPNGQNDGSAPATTSPEAKTPSPTQTVETAEASSPETVSAVEDSQSDDKKEAGAGEGKKPRRKSRRLR